MCVVENGIPAWEGDSAVAGGKALFSPPLGVEATLAAFWCRAVVDLAHLYGNL